MKLSQEFKEKLQEQWDEFQGYLEQKDRQIANIQEILQEEKDKVLNEKQQQIEALKEQILQIKQDHEEWIKAVEQQRQEEQQHQEKLQQIEEQIVQVKDHEEENQSSWAKERGADKITDSTKSTACEEDWKTWKAAEIKGTRTRTAQHEIRNASIPLHHVRLQPAEVKGHILAQFTHVHTPQWLQVLHCSVSKWVVCGDVGTHVSVYLWVWCHSPVAGKSHHHFTAPQSAQRQWPHHRDKNSFFGRDQRGRESICRC